MIYFNSTIVRLKDTGGLRVEFDGISFQFNYCTIKRYIIIQKVGSFNNFNSTIVRLKVFIQVLINISAQNFNSTIVRLKGETEVKAKDVEDDFNSTIVRLKEASS